MIAATVDIKVDIDNSNVIADQIKKLTGLYVYVGVPEKDASRDNEVINNAELAYIHTNGVKDKKAAKNMYTIEKGSPLWRIPPRPIIEPVIKKNEKDIDEMMQNVANNVLTNTQTNINTEMAKVGTFVRDKIKDNFTDPNNGWAPNSEATIKRKGSDKPLIDTGALRNSIDYVIAP